MNIYSEADWIQVFERHVKEVARKLAANDTTDTVVYETQELTVRVNVVDAATLETVVRIGHREFACAAEAYVALVPVCMTMFAKSTAMTVIARLPRAQ